MQNYLCKDDARLLIIEGVCCAANQLSHTLQRCRESHTPIFGRRKRLRKVEQGPWLEHTDKLRGLHETDGWGQGHGGALLGNRLSPLHGLADSFGSPIANGVVRNMSCSL